MKKLSSDVLIVGAGLTGLMAAYALSDLDIDIIVVDKFDFLSNLNDKYDLRTTAISEGSKIFFDKIKIWSDIEKFSEPIKKIKVIDRSQSNLLNFSNPSKNSSLGYIVKNTIIKKSIIKNISKKKNIKFLTNKNLCNISQNSENVTCQFNQFKVSAKLLIASDGKNSKVRDIIKTRVYKKKYNQKALVINFNHTKNHKSTAFEIFYNTGPLAILPMKRNKKNLFSSSLIWSHRQDFINNLCKLDIKILENIITEKAYYYIGDVKEIIDVQSFELSAHINKKFFENRIIYLGDAAHSIHPIAGQGWNVGVRDIESCLKVVQESLSLGLGLDSPSMCSKYHDMTYHDAYSLFLITDKLNKIFINEKYIVKKIRSLGFSALNKNDLVRNYITNFAMGL